MNERMTRRHFSKWLGCTTVGYGAISLFASTSLYSFAGSPAGIALTKLETETLIHYSYLLLPVLEPTNERYRAAVSTLTLQASQRPGVTSLIQEGLKTLNTTNKGLWLRLPPQERTAIVSSQAGTPFFNLLRWITTETVMRDPALWKKLGYQGSAIEHGGYLYRGFNDIDWLPSLIEEL